MSERSLILASLRTVATDLFATGHHWSGCKALFLLGFLLDRRTISRAQVGEIRKLAALVRV